MGLLSIVVLVTVCVAGPSQGQQIPLQDPPPSTDADVETSAPYIVFVANQDVCARCGPGDEHYRTDPLRRGQELEVYVETESGWLGIRPPEKSFCWLPEDAVEAMPEDEGDTGNLQIGTIEKDKTVAWIGTHLGQAKRYRWQVMLSAGEPVTIIGRSERETATGKKTWLRIMPPSGEFRWIHRDQIVESAEQLADRIAQATTMSTDDTMSTNDNDDQQQVVQTGNLEGPTLASPLPMSDSLVDEALSSDRSTRRGATTSALTQTDSIPDLRPAPARVTPDTAIQIHRDANPEDFEDRGAVIGSGLKKEWNQDAMQGSMAVVDDGAQSVLADNPLGAAPIEQTTAIATPIQRVTNIVANFISPPRLVEINSSRPNALAGAIPTDRRWMVGSDRPLTRSSSLPLPASLASGSGQNGGIVQASAVSAIPREPRVISVAQISRVEKAVAEADLDRIRQILSRLMAEGASADELNPLLRRTQALLDSSDAEQADLIREILQRAQRYHDLAGRRDGATRITSVALGSESPALESLSLDKAASLIADPSASPINTANTATANSTENQPINVPLGPTSSTASGYLVQVYSSRANSPPFALTDDSGLTIAYVTPYPGVNLRNHLNSRIAVQGIEKMLQGMNTPHILVDQAVRR
ncbi:hypothetical protein NHH03_21250 [Stieleria sp. TO1_6]|uniref:hypothetical protein n=1 Tax=Stieleria tagensis TaxID=2956795 RepID=UPI00209AD221|nr:hypothetical protein [Stieleria tagensis]MCO8124283.1 hypothetical protein [Stieleria tagensis]